MKRRYGLLALVAFAGLITLELWQEKRNSVPVEGPAAPPPTFFDYARVVEEGRFIAAPNVVEKTPPKSLRPGQFFPVYGGVVVIRKDFEDIGNSG